MTSPIENRVLDTDSFVSARWANLEEKGQILYTAYVLPDKRYTCSKFGEELSEKIDCRIIDGGETWVTAGRPVYLPYEDFLKTFNLEPSPEILTQLDEFKFGYLKLSCGFGGHGPPNPHPMTSGKMTTTLTCNVGKPMAYEWLPKDLMDERNIEKEYSITPEFNIGPFKIGTGYKKHIEFSELKPRISVVGSQTEKITWRYHTTPLNAIITGGREARVIVRLPHNAKSLSVTVDIQATVKENFLERVFPSSRKWKPEDFMNLEEEEFILSRGISITYQDIHSKRWTPRFAEYLLSKPNLTDEDKTISYVT